MDDAWFKGELIAIATIAVLVLLAGVPAFIHARTQARDNLRIIDITNLRRGIELYYNTHEHYPPLAEEFATCEDSLRANSFVFGSESVLVDEQHLDAIPHDVREGNGHVYRYCIVGAPDQPKGYFVEAHFELTRPATIGFDEDESRKFNYRILYEGGKTLYRVCGGTEMQCKSDGE